ncbi:MAG: AAA family ATPase [bacterium]
MINNIKIRGYKSIQDMDLDLCTINILIGANGSGKTNLLSFFEFLQNIYLQNLKEYVALRGNTDRFLFNGRKVTDEISAKLTFHSNAYFFELKSAEDSFIFTKESLFYNYQEVIRRTYKEEADIKFYNSSCAEHIRDYLKSFEKYHFHDTTSNSPFTKVSNINTDTHQLYSNGRNLAARLYYIRDQDFVTYKFIVKTIQSVAPYFGDFFLNPDENGNILLKWHTKYSTDVYGVTALSDGTQRFIALVVLFLQQELPKTIILDEPELGLHPAAIAKLSSLIKSAAAKGSQIIVATQSTDLISFFQAEDIVAVDQVDGKSQFKRLKEEDISLWIEDFYTIGELWKRNIITNAQP